MRLRRSSLVHLVDLADGATLCLHAATQQRFVVTRAVAELIRRFDDWTEPEHAAAGPGASACIEGLVEAGVLVTRSAHEEERELAERFSPLYGRDPERLVDRFRRERQSGQRDYWAAGAPRGVEDLGPCRHKATLIALGDCDVGMETEFLRREARARSIDLEVAATAIHDVALVAERPHDAVLVGALPSRASVADDEAGATFLAQMRLLLELLREITNAPILVNNLPIPTVSPLGIADHGIDSHRERFRGANLELVRLVSSLPGVWIADVEAATAGFGSHALLDDGLVSFTHMGSPGWMLQRPDFELDATGGEAPPLAGLADALGGDPYLLEQVMARAHVDLLVAVLGFDRKKCVVVDLDGTLWPGVLAEAGRPFEWAPDVTSPYSFVGLYLGVHEALKALQSRGLLLACVSKNDERTVLDAWHYPDDYPRERMVTPDAFVSRRIDWRDKATNIEEIADELGLALDAFAFVDDTAAEREWVRQKLPEVAVFGDDLSTLRRELLTDPRLQPLEVTAEAADRTRLVKDQARRRHVRREARDPREFAESLELHSEVGAMRPGQDARRVAELLARTTQFNTTGLRLRPDELEELVERPDGRVVTLRMRDRFGDQGLVGACVVDAGVIRAMVLSCRVLGLGLEQVLLREVLADGGELIAELVPTERNLPARNVYVDAGFQLGEDGRWAWRARAPGSDEARLEPAELRGGHD